MDGNITKEEALRNIVRWYADWIIRNKKEGARNGDLIEVSRPADGCADAGRVVTAAGVEGLQLPGIVNAFVRTEG